MPQYVALIVWALIIIWLFARERKLHPMSSVALWIPLLWVMLVGSRTVTYWLNFDIDPEQIYASSVEGSLIDGSVFIILVVGAAITLWRRRLNWGQVFTLNFWLFVFLLYCGLSVIWSDYPFPSFKKWIKDLGNILMILIIFTESNPVSAIKAIFTRYVYFAITLSALLTVFFPEISTHYVQETGTLSYCGVATNKNELGHILAICGLFMTWDLVAGEPAKKLKIDILVSTALAAMMVWLWIMADSMTPLLCMILGMAVIIVMRLPAGERFIRHLGVYSLLIGFVFLILTAFPEIIDSFFQLVGRDTTFTGRTDIWTGLLQEPVNPIIGTGFQSFWLQPYVIEQYGNVNEAHNGYLETYLNGGLIGLSLLIAALVSVGSKIKHALLRDKRFFALLFSFFVVTVFYNLTESVFNRLDLTWFVFLIAALGSTQPLSSECEQEVEGAVLMDVSGGRR